MEHDPLVQFLHLLKQKIIITEKQFWELSNEEGHSEEQEITLAKELMMQERHIQLIDQTIKLRNQDKTLNFAFPMKYAMNLIQNPEIIEEYQQYNIIDVSEEFEKINFNTITDEQVKGYLIMKFGKTIQVKQLKLIIKNQRLQKKNLINKKRKQWKKKNK